MRVLPKPENQAICTMRRIALNHATQIRLQRRCESKFSRRDDVHVFIVDVFLNADFVLCAATLAGATETPLNRDRVLVQISW